MTRRAREPLIPATNTRHCIPPSSRLPSPTRRYVRLPVFTLLYRSTWPAVLAIGVRFIGTGLHRTTARPRRAHQREEARARESHCAPRPQRKPRVADVTDRGEAFHVDRRNRRLATCHAIHTRNTVLIANTQPSPQSSRTGAPSCALFPWLPVFSVPGKDARALLMRPYSGDSETEGPRRPIHRAARDCR